jgi:hypothetical protein
MKASAFEDQEHPVVAVRVSKKSAVDLVVRSEFVQLNRHLMTHEIRTNEKDQINSLN